MNIKDEVKYLLGSLNVACLGQYAFFIGTAVLGTEPIRNQTFTVLIMDR
jgi:hypothetical protein